MFIERKVLAFVGLAAWSVSIILHIVYLVRRHTTSTRIEPEQNFRILISALVFLLIAIFSSIGLKVTKEDQKSTVELEER